MATDVENGLPYFHPRGDDDLPSAWSTTCTPTSLPNPSFSHSAGSSPSSVSN